MLKKAQAIPNQHENEGGVVIHRPNLVQIERLRDRSGCKLHYPFRASNGSSLQRGENATAEPKMKKPRARRGYCKLKNENDPYFLGILVWISCMRPSMAFICPTNRASILRRSLLLTMLKLVASFTTLAGSDSKRVSKP